MGNSINFLCAFVAQPDRASDFESAGCTFESCQTHLKPGSRLAFFIFTKKTEGTDPYSQAQACFFYILLSFFEIFSILLLTFFFRTYIVLNINATSAGKQNGRLAQLVEQQTLNLRVAGSIPVSLMKTSQLSERFFYYQNTFKYSFRNHLPCNF